MFLAHNYNKAPPQQPPIHRRHPLTNAVTVNHHIDDAQKALPKPPSSPPLPRQNAKITPPSPPKIIIDKTGRLQFARVGFLGEGGFARVYEVKDPRNHRLACKVVTKSSLETKKAKTKLYAEIKIHKALQHPNIVGFQDCFEDGDNVYMTLELCGSGSLMDLLRRRRRFTEPEARFFMIQLIGACHYMHAHQVIHRDLKLGNLFLDSSMNIKVGDFGLAALIENPGERKKTICGTPNYIAPEVLFDTANGHSFEVDIWSIGVILYTFIIGRPPFQTKDVKAIYKRIRDNEYEFPTNRIISSGVQQLIQQILTHNPSERPSLHEIVDHVFFTKGPVPSYIPTSALDSAPDFRHITKPASDSNLRRLRKYSMLDVDYSSSVPASGSSENVVVDATAKNITSSIAQQEKEFQKAVQPGSPISALLGAARQPLLMSTNAAAASTTRDIPLLRKLQAVKESPLGRRSVTRGMDGVIEETRGMGRGRLDEINLEDGEGGKLRSKELESQKVRIVAQMAPVKEEQEQEMDGDAMDVDLETKKKFEVPERLVPRKMRAREPLPFPTVPVVKEPFPAAVPQETETFAPLASRHGKHREQPYVIEKENIQVPSSKRDAPPRPLPVFPSAPSLATTRLPPSKYSSFEITRQTLAFALDALAEGKVFRNPHGSDATSLPHERVFIVNWLDYCQKYGMAYTLTDGSIGCYFNDSSTLVLSPDKLHFDYVAARRHGTVMVRKNYTINEYPEELKNKIYLMKHFERYMTDKLYGDYEFAYVDGERTKGMEWVQIFLRMKKVIVFKLSHDVIQFNFGDHTKLILSSGGLMVTYIDKDYKLSRWTLREIMSQSLPSMSKSTYVGPSKSMQRIVVKLRYSREVLASIVTSSAKGGPIVEDNIDSEILHSESVNLIAPHPPLPVPNPRGQSSAAPMPLMTSMKANANTNWHAREAGHSGGGGNGAKMSKYGVGPQGAASTLPVEAVPLGLASRASKITLR